MAPVELAPSPPPLPSMITMISIRFRVLPLLAVALIPAAGFCDGDDAAAFLREARAEYEKGNFDGALADLDKAAALEPGNTDILCYRTEIREARGDGDENADGEIYRLADKDAVSAEDYFRAPTHRR